jgi:hypothetical protein
MGLWTMPPAPPVVEVAERGAEEEDGSTGVPVPGSAGLGRRQSGDATTVKATMEERSVRACSGHGERGRRGGGGADARAPFFRVRGGAGRPGVGEERAAAVVRHNGDEGGHFRRGSAGVVVGSDEGWGAPAVTGAEATSGGGSNGGQPEEDDQAGPACLLGAERGECGAR